MFCGKNLHSDVHMDITAAVVTCNVWQKRNSLKKPELISWTVCHSDTNLMGYDCICGKWVQPTGTEPRKPQGQKEPMLISCLYQTLYYTALTFVVNSPSGLTCFGGDALSTGSLVKMWWLMVAWYYRVNETWPTTVFLFLAGFQLLPFFF